jgi:hypothetical protein
VLSVQSGVLSVQSGVLGRPDNLILGWTKLGKAKSLARLKLVAVKWCAKCVKW